MKQLYSGIKPFLSIMIVISTLFGLVFFKMEERRLGYEILQLTHEQQKTMEEKRGKAVMLARITRPQLVENTAQRKMTLRKVQSSQIIRLTGSTPITPINREVN